MGTADRFFRNRLLLWMFLTGRFFAADRRAALWYDLPGSIYLRVDHRPDGCRLSRGRSGVSFRKKNRKLLPAQKGQYFPKTEIHTYGRSVLSSLRQLGVGYRALPTDRPYLYSHRRRPGKITVGSIRALQRDGSLPLGYQCGRNWLLVRATIPGYGEPYRVDCISLSSHYRPTASALLVSPKAQEIAN